jgi:hypothetical protein
VIAFGSALSGAEAYRRYAGPGLRLVAEPDSEIVALAAIEPIGRTYNLLLDAVADREDLEAFVLVHPNTEIVDPEFCAKIRRVLADPGVGVVGCAGANDVHSIAWWEGSVVAAPGTHRYGEFGGGDLPAHSWTRQAAPPAEVEALDGQLLVLSPWVVRNHRFDEGLLLGHGFDVDFSLAIREAGRKLIVEDLRVVYHRSLELVAEINAWIEAHIRIGRKWNGVLVPDAPSQDEPDSAAWKRRARRAEAQREAARAVAFSQALLIDARVLELERELAEKTDSASWRATAPLRMLNRWRRTAADRRSAR